MNLIDLKNELKRTLADLYSNSGDIQRVVNQSGLRIQSFNFSDNAANIWDRVVDRAIIHGRLNHLSKIISADGHDTTSIDQLIRRISTEQKSSITGRFSSNRFVQLMRYHWGLTLIVLIPFLVIVSGVTIWYLISDGGPLNNAIDISGEWMTPDQNLTYTIKQNNKDFTWTIKQNMMSGQGEIDDHRILITMNGSNVTYEPVLLKRGKPVVLFSLHPKFAGTVLFKECDSFQKFLNSLQRDFPKMEPHINLYLDGISQPTCK